MQEKLEGVYQSLQEKGREHEAKMEAERTKTAQVSLTLSLLV